MNYSFSVSYDGMVIETKWLGKLSGEIIAEGCDDRNVWIENNAKEMPLVLLSDYSGANVENITPKGLRLVADRFRGLSDEYPGVFWVSIVPTDLKFGLARMWQTYAAEIFSNTHVARSRDDAEKVIFSIVEANQS